MSAPSLAPTVTIEPRALEGRGRLGVRWMRFGARSIRSRDWDFVGHACQSIASLSVLTAADTVRRDDRHECNICTWTGRRFYPNTGPGYHESDTLCPGCRGIDRHRSLLALLTSSTDFFLEGNRIVEVAPMRGFEQLCRAQAGLDYTSFDLERHAMERGDITDMRFETDSVDYFVCFHVLEHIPDAEQALSEIWRVLRPGGTAVFQVPIDWDSESTLEYGAPDPRDVGHVRQYGSDFGARLEAAGFKVSAISVNEVYDPPTIERYGLSTEPIFLASK